ncbi:MAG: hypothetical protein CVV57_04370 [Tenericutes bacterium HGW-Tenericutes-2]|jgi:hypothetical protein|nr:MAG: hypothetical protein CVV57_04370 [Tenericutes bacterium HGW-Tenericutes-2]
MRTPKIIISEPWDFINPRTNDNSMTFSHKKQVEYKGTKVDLVRLVKPFEYLGQQVEILILVPRYQKKNNKTFNILIVDEDTSDNVIDNAKYMFIGSLEP